jgi:hypothetical protein
VTLRQEEYAAPVEKRCYLQELEVDRLAIVEEEREAGHEGTWQVSDNLKC